ncbi:MAG: hypothetical protein WCE79_17225 [Xanthobacteraceae bacterium]
MLGRDELLRMQREQFRHDERNHKDILCLSKPDRLKHYGLHYAKYVGRLARGAAEEKSEEQTLVDAILVALSTANTLLQDLSKEDFSKKPALSEQIDPLRVFADAMGRFADACEKIDHFEDNHALAHRANIEVLRWLLNTVGERNIDIAGAIKQRRAELSKRHFYIAD